MSPEFVALTEDVPGRLSSFDLRRGLVVPLVLAALFLIGNAIVGVSTMRNLARLHEEVEESLRHIVLLQEVEVRVLAAETGQRGYLITDLPEYAEPYYEALKNVDEQLKLLGDSMTHPDQRRRYAKLRRLVLDKLDELALTMEAVRANREQEAIQQVFTHEGRFLMTGITETLQEMMQHEEDQLALGASETRAARSTTMLLILTANLVGSVMVIIGMLLLQHTRRQEAVTVERLREAHDALERKVAERTRALQHYSSELQRSNRELEDFAFVASHDLQEPLRKIRAFGDRLSASYSDELGDRGQDYLARMQKASARMSKLIEDLLSFSRITTKAKPFEAVDLAAVLDEVLDDLEVAIEEADAIVEYDALPQVEADRFQMKQLLQNLLGNAVKFRRDGVAPRIEVRVKICQDEHRVELSVEDNGIGFDEEFAEQMFLPFQRLHGRDRYAGTGIGLAICRRIAERHGGTLSATSKPDAGSRFTVTLPLRQHQQHQKVMREVQEK